MKSKGSKLMRIFWGLIGEVKIVTTKKNKQDHLIAIFLMREGETMLQEENESEITSLKKKLEVHMARNELLQNENQELREEVVRLKSQIISLKAHNMERKSVLWKKLQKSIDDNNNSEAHQQHKAPPVQVITCEKSSQNENVHTNPGFQDSAAPRKDKPAIVPPAPPPRPSPTLLLPPLHKKEKGLKVQPTIAPPPPPTPPKLSLVGLKSVRRVPEVIELYRSLTRKDANMENRIHSNGIPTVAFTRNMIEEIENRSTYLSAIKSEVQRQGEFISFLIKEVESTSFADVSEVESFVKWLDGELSSLVDERSVLKHFPQWPEQKVDALREAACNYRDLKNLESEVSSYDDNPKEPLKDTSTARQASILERSVSAKERMRESTSKRYRNFHIPWEWMLDTGIIGQMKLSSLKMAKEFMKRITKELESNELLQEDNLFVQGVKFAFRVHQFAGGFDTETIEAFEELKKIGCAIPSYSVNFSLSAPLTVKHPNPKILFPFEATANQKTLTFFVPYLQSSVAAASAIALSRSRNSEESMVGNSEEDRDGLHQSPLRIPELLYVSVKMQNPNLTLSGDLLPHISGSCPSGDPSKALSMERESASVWELSFVVPPNHEALEFKFLLKPKYIDNPCFVEEGPSRVLIGGALQYGDRLALFRLDNDQVLEYRVFVEAKRASPFDLAASWRAYQENFRLSTVRGIPDVSINSEVQTGSENISSVSLELDLEHYIVPSPPVSASSALVYAANMTENPRSLDSGFASISSSTVDGGVPMIDQPETVKFMEVNAPDPAKVYQSPGMVKSQSAGTILPLQKEGDMRGLLVDRGVGVPRLVKSSSSYAFTTNLNLYTDTKNSIPAAAGAVAAAAIADQMLGPKEHRHLAIVMVSLPARGKTYTAAKLTRYLRWLGHNTKHFNVGKYRRLKHGSSQENLQSMSYSSLQSADFFRADNPEGVEARNEVAKMAFEDMISWMQEGGQVGIFDATNSSKQRRNMLMKLAEGRCKIIFLETICNDVDIIERNIRFKIQQSPDYAEVSDFEAGLRDFKERVANYEKASLSYVYETVEEGSYIKMIDMASGHGGQIQVKNISGYLPGRIYQHPLLGLFGSQCATFLSSRMPCHPHAQPTQHTSAVTPARALFRREKFTHMTSDASSVSITLEPPPSASRRALLTGEHPLQLRAFVNTHLTPRPILLTRHGESQYNVRGRIGGDSALSEAGELYKKKLAKFVEKRLKSERAACIWTSTLQRTILTAGPIVGFPKIQWRALDEINAGVCDGKTYEEIKKNMPEEYESRNKDKLRYRYPRGESYLDVIQRLEPVIIELERQRAPVVVISHQAVLRALYAYFTDRPLKEIADIEMPLHTIIEIQLGVTGVEEKRYKLMD
ncbi:6-phosphofructo-2-kinase/fructose-2,6-bisphosphatase [Glycine soja]